jgi:adenylosuccinate synthase
MLAAGAIVDPPVLIKEIEDCGVSERLGIDNNAAILDDNDSRTETDLGLRARIGSTLSGTGMVTSRKVLRDSRLRLAKSEPKLAKWIVDTASEIAAAHDRGERIIIEGTQGFGLSLHHGGHYPFATSRDTSASGFLSEAGVSPLIVDEIVMVVRTYPIRVGGNSGPLPNETTWAEVRAASGAPHDLTEFTTVTSRPRRVARFDFGVVERAAMVNRPTYIALHGLDYLDYKDLGALRFADLSSTSRSFIDQLEQRLGIPVAFLFTGPDNTLIIDRRQSAATFANSTLGMETTNG